MASTTSKQLGVDQASLCGPLEAVGSKGIFLGENPLDFPYPLALAQIIIVVLTSRILYSFLGPIGQTKFVCNLLGGLILGPSMLGHRKEVRDRLTRAKEAPMFESMALVGAIYSMFIVAVKFDTHMMRKTAKNTWKIGLPGFLFALAVSLGLTFMVGWTISGLKGGFADHLFSVSSLSFTFFPVVAQALDELNLTTSELGQLAMSSSLITEGIQWMTSTIQIILMKDMRNAVLTFFSIVAMIVTCVYVIRPLILVIVKKTPEGKEVKENYVVAILLGVLVMAFISDMIGATCIIGPVVLGLVIPNGPPLGAALITKMEFIVSEFFLPVFFFRIGLKTNVYSITDWKSFVRLQMIIVLTYAAKILAVTVAAWFSKITFKNGLLLGLLMNIKGTIDVLLYGRHFRYRLLDEQCFSQIVFSMLLVTMVVTPIVRFAYKPQVRLGPTTIQNSLHKSIQSLESNSELCILCCVHNKESVRNITSLLEASNPTQESPIFAYVIHAVELIGRDAPLLVPYKREKKKLDHTNSPTHQMMRAFWNYSKNSRGPVGLQSFTMIAPYKSMHETVCRLADDSLIPLIILPFHDNHQCMLSANVPAGVRQFNINLQAHSPCTVGILVERGLSGRLSMAHFSYNVAVFFIGGPDDREALAYAARMSGNPDVCITVFRIILRSKMEEDGSEEASLDESLVDEFKLKNVGNECVNWLEIEVADGVAVMDAIRNSQGDYDLVLAGRRHADMSLRDEEMADFVQNAELGVIGDMLASSDFCGGMVNVLVLQESRQFSSGALRSGSTKSTKSTKSDSRFK